MLLEDFYAGEILDVQLFFCPAMSLFGGSAVVHVPLWHGGGGSHLDM